MEKRVGWALPLGRPELFRDVLLKFVEMENAEYLKWSERAREYGRQVSRDDEVVERNRELFGDLWRRVGSRE